MPVLPMFHLHPARARARAHEVLNVRESNVLTLACAVQVLFATFFGITILGDQVSMLGLFGSVLIATGVVLANASKTPKSSGMGESLPMKAPAFPVPPADEESALTAQHYSHGQHLRTGSTDLGVSNAARKAGVHDGQVVVELQPTQEHLRHAKALLQ